MVDVIMPKFKIVYFVFLNENFWEKIVIEQLNSLIECGIYEDSQSINLVVVGKQNEIDKLKKILDVNYKKVIIRKTSQENHFEFLGFELLYELSHENEKDIILYFHTKGVTSGLKNNLNNLLRNVLYLKTIKNYKTYLFEFEKNNNLDLAGTFPGFLGFIYYNFFWVKGSYIKNYCPKPEKNKNRFYWEAWLGHPHSTKKEIITFSPITEYEKIKSKNELYVLRDKIISEKN